MNTGKTIWLFGLPCSGKTTLAKAVIEKYPFFVHLDGDIVRKGLNSDLGFSMEDRAENLRRAKETAKILNQQGINVICTFITPTNEIRKEISKDFYCLWVECDSNLQTCIKRDVKGMYKKALAGELPNFTGVEQRYDSGRQKYAILINTDDVPVSDSLKQLEDSTDCFEHYTNPTYYYQDSMQKERHLSFIGRWNPFHNGHKYIIQKKLEDNPDLPVLIYVRDTSFDTSASLRAEEVRKWLKENHIRGTICIIPDIKGVYIGRKVGYEVERIEVPKEIFEISGTKIRQENKK